MHVNILIILFVSFSSIAWAFFPNESDDDNGLKKTVWRLLDTTKGTFNPSNKLEQGDFPYRKKEPDAQDQLPSDLLYTKFYLGTSEGASPAAQYSHQTKATNSEGIRQDGRVVIPNSRKLPYRIHGYLDFTYEDDVRARGSGTLVGPRHVITAGHNIYSHTDSRKGNDKRWVKSVKFVPGMDENHKPFGEIEGILALTVENWIAPINYNYKDAPREKVGYDVAHQSYDIGMIILEEDIGFKTGWAGMLAAPDEYLLDTLIHVSGYPSVHPGDANIGHNTNPESTVRRTTQMWTMSGHLKKVPEEDMRDRLIYDIDTGGGQSGAGVWIKFPGSEGYFVVGDHAYGSEDGNKAARITPTKFKRLISWINTFCLRGDKDKVTRLRGFSTRADNLETFLGLITQSVSSPMPHKKANAQFEIGNRYRIEPYIYDDERRVPENLEFATIWYKKAWKQDLNHNDAKSKYIDLCCEIGDSFYSGRGCTKLLGFRATTTGFIPNFTIADEWYKKAWEAGNWTCGGLWYRSWKLNVWQAYPVVKWAYDTPLGKWFFEKLPEFQTDPVRWGPSKLNSRVIDRDPNSIERRESDSITSEKKETDSSTKKTSAPATGYNDNAKRAKHNSSTKQT